MAVSESRSESIPASPIVQWLADHPLAGYFLIAYLGAWITLLPVLLSENGIGWLAFTIPDALLLLSFVLISAAAGPTLAALVMTKITGGQVGLREFLRRYVDWRVGLRWYAAALFTFLVLFLFSATLSQGGSVPIAAAMLAPVILPGFLGNTLLFSLMGFLGEEPGWRGFALPRLQTLHGPIGGTLILGLLHSLWHLPAFFIQGHPLGPFTPTLFTTFVLTGIAATFIYTWIYNNTGGSILLAILTHAASNAASAAVSSLLQGTAPTSQIGEILSSQHWDNVIAFGTAALILVVATRGTLSHRSPQSTS